MHQESEEFQTWRRRRGEMRMVEERPWAKLAIWSRHGLGGGWRPSIAELGGDRTFWRWVGEATRKGGQHDEGARPWAGSQKKVGTAKKHNDNGHGHGKHRRFGSCCSAALAVRCAVTSVAPFYWVSRRRGCIPLLGCSCGRGRRRLSHMSWS